MRASVANACRSVRHSAISNSRQYDQESQFERGRSVQAISQCWFRAKRLGRAVPTRDFVLFQMFLCIGNVDRVRSSPAIRAEVFPGGRIPSVVKMFHGGLHGCHFGAVSHGSMTTSFPHRGNPVRPFSEREELPGHPQWLAVLLDGQSFVISPAAD